MTEGWKQLEGQVADQGFRLLQYLGGSDHGAVFLTECGEREPRKAAIKLVRADREDAELQLSRWRLAANLFHPNLIRLFQMGRWHVDDTQLLYVVMEYAEENLSQVVPFRPLTPAEAREMLKPVLNALAYIHGKGFVHGRIKPANIMALGDEIKLSSDGLCRIGERTGGLDSADAYAAPESASGKLSPAGDVWSLGMTLVEALTQRLPVRQDTQRAEPVLPQTLPSPFLDIARHCLRWDPERRWTLEEISARLQPTSPAPQKQTLQERTIPKPQVTFVKWRYIVPAAVAGLTLAAILAGSRLFSHHPAAQRTPSVALEQPRTKRQRSFAPEAGQSPRSTSNKKLGYSGTAPSSNSAPSEAGAKTPAGSVVQGEVFQQVLPDVPKKARDTIRGTVRVSVRVNVDPSGGVAGATFDSPGPSKYFANLALEAARRWEFWPAKVDGRNVASEWILRFAFKQTSTNVIPVRSSP